VRDEQGDISVVLRAPAYYRNLPAGQFVPVTLTEFMNTPTTSGNDLGDPGLIFSLVGGICLQPWKLLTNDANKIQKQCDYNDGANDAQSSPCTPSRIAVIATATTEEQKQNDKQNQHSIPPELVCLENNSACSKRLLYGERWMPGSNARE
jgi:hypothetical protein